MRSFSVFVAAATATVAVTGAAAAFVPDGPSSRFALHRRGQAASSGSSSGGSLVLTGPSPGDVFKQGSTCPVTWTPDTSGSDTWKSFTLDLMTGSNLAMKKLKTVATGLDGTSSGAGKHEWPCPEVQPNSAIYFYQATTDGSSNPQWTTRFAIADQKGNTTPPKHANQPKPSTPAIPWGNGKLASGSGSNAGAGSGSSTSASNSASATSGSASTSEPSSAASASSSSDNSSGATTSSAEQHTGSPAASTTASGSASSSGSTDAASPSTSATSPAGFNRPAVLLAMAGGAVVAAASAVL